MRDRARAGRAERARRLWARCARSPTVRARRGSCVAGVVRAGGSGAAPRRAAAGELSARVSVDPVMPSSATAVTSSPIRSATPTATQRTAARGSARRRRERSRSPRTERQRGSDRRVAPVRGREAVGGSSRPGAENSAAMASSVVLTARSSSSGCAHSAASRSCSSRGMGWCTAIWSAVVANGRMTPCRRERTRGLQRGQCEDTARPRSCAECAGSERYEDLRGGEVRFGDDSCPVVRPSILEE